MNNQTLRYSVLFAAAAIGASLFAPLARTQAQSQPGVDRVSVTLSDPSRPAMVKAGLVNGGITVKAYEGKEVVVEARPRNRDSGRSDGNPKRIVISSTGRGGKQRSAHKYRLPHARH
jgi:hypothetical protein